MRDLQAKSSSNKPQMLHVLDGVLEPLEMRSSSPGSRRIFVGLTAGKLLRRHRLFDLGVGRGVGKFARRTWELTGYAPFDRTGVNTFFVPVDSVFEEMSEALVTADVVRGHVVPGELLFTRPANKSRNDEYHFRQGVCY